MTRETAKYIVFRGGAKRSCKGEDISDKVQDSDYMLVNRSGNWKRVLGSKLDTIADSDYLICYDTDNKWKRVRGSDFKDLLTPPDPPWEVNFDNYVHVIWDENRSVSIGKKQNSWDKSPQLYRLNAQDEYVELIEEIDGPGRYMIAWDGVRLQDARLRNNNANFEFGPLTDTTKIETFDNTFFTNATYEGKGIQYLQTDSAIDFENMFRDCYVFNQDVGHFKTSKVTNMGGMFYNCREFTGSGVENFDTSKVGNFTFMFYFNYKFNGNVSGWTINTSPNVSIGAKGMFKYNLVFNRPLNNWDTRNFVNIEEMFDNAEKFNQPLNNWKTGKATNMMRTFQNASIFDQNLTSWCVSQIQSRPAGFKTGSALTFANEPKWGTCP